MNARRLQFRLSTLIVVTVVIAIIGAFAAPYLRRKYYNITPELERIDHADPEADATAAFSQKDYRFAALYGLGLSVPGVPQNLQDKFGAKPISGTSDCIVSSEQGRLQDKARTYAERYNAAMLEKLSKMK